MKRNAYIRMTDNMKAKPGLQKFLTAVNKVGPWVFGVLFGLLVLFLGMAAPMGAVRLVVVAGGGFLLVQLITNYLDYPRPYQKFGVEPAIPEEKADGHTLPCKHAYWYTIISMSYFFALAYPLRLIGVVLMILGLGLCAVRVVGGLHFTRDVVAGVVLAVVFGLVGLMS